jgi:hypothetical protein
MQFTPFLFYCVTTNTTVEQAHLGRLTTSYVHLIYYNLQQLSKHILVIVQHLSNEA